MTRQTRDSVQFVSTSSFSTRLFKSFVLLDLTRLEEKSSQQLARLARSNSNNENLVSFIQKQVSNASSAGVLLQAMKHPKGIRYTIFLPGVGTLIVMPFRTHRLLCTTTLLAADAFKRGGTKSTLDISRSVRFLINETEKPLSLRCPKCRGTGRYGKRKPCFSCDGAGKRRCKIYYGATHAEPALPENIRQAAHTIHIGKTRIPRGRISLLRDVLRQQTTQTNRETPTVGKELKLNEHLQRMRQFVDIQEQLSLGSEPSITVKRISQIDAHSASCTLPQELSPEAPLERGLLRMADDSVRQVELKEETNSLTVTSKAPIDFPPEVSIVLSASNRSFRVQRAALSWWEHQSATRSPIKAALLGERSSQNVLRRAKTEETYFNPRIRENEPQRNAVVSAVTGDAAITCIQGPPGTGKTSVIQEIILQLCASGIGPILIASQSNLAVDNVLTRLVAQNQLIVCRIGNDKKISSELLAYEYRRQAQRLIQDQIKQTRSAYKNQTRRRDLLKTLLAEDSILDTLSRHPEITRNSNSLETRPHRELLEAVITRIKMCSPHLSSLTLEQFENLEALRSWAVDQVRLIEQLKPLQSKWEDTLQEHAMAPEEFLRSAVHAIGATCIGADASFIRGTDSHAKAFSRDSLFEVVIIDEAGRSTPMETLVPLQFGKRAILVGDHKQLPPFVSQEERKVWNKIHPDSHGKTPADESLLERLMRSTEPEAIHILRKQFRMHPQIADFVSSVFYKDEGLENGVRPEERSLPLPHFPDAMSLHTTRQHGKRRFEQQEQHSKSWFNNAEIEEVLKLLSFFTRHHRTHLDVGVIAFYGAQVERLQSAMRTENLSGISLDIATLDSYQGQERDIIIISLVRCPRHIETFDASWYRFFLDVRRLNVALSRARKRLCIVGDIERILEIKQQREQVPGFSVLEKMESYASSHDLHVLPEVLNDA